jgi:predicted MFS family arabinose efflux permease
VTARGLTGLVSGLVYVAAVSLAAHLASQARISPGISLGILQAGVGAGIAASGIVVFGLALKGDQSWQLVWVAQGLVSLAALVPVIRTLSRVREPQPAGRQGTSRPAGSIAGMTPTIAGYFFFGLGYIAYMTFIVALLRTHGAHGSTITLFWVVLGASAIVGSIAWGVIVDRVKGGLGPAAVLGTAAVGAVLPVLSDSATAAIVSALIFGSSFLATTTAVVVVARRILPAPAWTLAIGLLTTAFGIGQSIGPALAGAISDGPGGIKAGLGLSAAFLVAGSIVLAIQREPRETRTKIALG